MLPYHFLVIGNVAIFSFIFDKWFEAIIFLSAYFSLRYKFDDTFHAESILNCMLITNTMFILSVVCCPTFQTYIFGGLLFAYFDCAILWRLQVVKKLKQDKESAERLVLEFTKAENKEKTFRENCKTAKLSKRDTEIAVKYYVEGWKPKDIWLWLCKNKDYEAIEWDSVYQLLWRIGVKLKK